MLRRFKDWARAIRRDVHALYLAARGPRTPWYAKAFALAIAAYALSPIDLIPDFIPVLGYLDEVILLPLAIALAIRLMPRDVMAEHRIAAAKAEGRPVSRAGATFVVALWLLAAGALLHGRHALVGLLRQSVFGRLAGYEMPFSDRGRKRKLLVRRG